MEMFSHWEERLDRLSPNKLLAINAALFGFVLLAHGGAMLISKTSAWHGPAPNLSTVYFTVPIAIAALASVLFALAKPAALTTVLKIHSLFLLAGSGFLAIYGIKLAAVGVPPGTPIRWNPILFAFISAYPVWLARKVFVVDPALRAWRVAPAAAIALSAAISAGVFWRILDT